MPRRIVWVTSCCVCLFESALSARGVSAQLSLSLALLGLLPACGDRGSGGAVRIRAAVDCNADSDGDGMDDCEEAEDGDIWTDPAVFNGVEVRLADACHVEPDCAAVDELAEVEACEATYERLDQSAGWDFSTRAKDNCHAGFGFAPQWSRCRAGFQIDARGFVQLSEDGWHCFEVAGDADQECAALFFDDRVQAVVAHDGPRCFDVPAGVYPIRWFYEVGESVQHALHIRYCEGGDTECEPQEALPAGLLRPAYDPDRPACEEGGECSDLCPCEAGQRRCEDDGDCVEGLTCGEGNGQRFGQAEDERVCWSPSCEDDPVAAGCGTPDARCGYCPEVCENAEDDDHDGAVDCDDSECAERIICEPEICDNGLDENANDLIDCADPDCRWELHCACGNGVREVNREGVPREGCDDGNRVDGDACSSDCEPTLATGVAGDTAVVPPEGGAVARASDGAGTQLAVWTAEVDGQHVIRAGRATAGGAPIDSADAALELVTNLDLGWPARPAVAGLSDGGWVVAWGDPEVDGDSSGIAYRRVEEDGSLGPVRQANQIAAFAQHTPRLAAVGDGFVAVWVDESQAVAGHPFIAARRFDANALPVSDPWELSDATAGDKLQPAIAASGSDWIVAWTDAGVGEVRIRRYFDTTSLDAVGLPVGLDAHTPAVAASKSGSGDFAVAFTAADDDLAQATFALPIHADITPSPAQAVRVANEPDGRSEHSPDIAALEGAAFLVAWSYGDARDADVAVLDPRGAWSAVPELQPLRDALLGPSRQTDISLVPADDGVWVSWLDDAGASSGDATPVPVSYFLPDR